VVLFILYDFWVRRRSGSNASCLQGLGSIPVYGPCMNGKATTGRCQRPEGIRPWPQRQSTFYCSTQNYYGANHRESRKMLNYCRIN